jgi:hypothetical protein
MFSEVVQKEFPLRDPPKSRHLMIVEANHERGNDIEFLTEVRERTERLDSLDDAADTEQVRDFPEHWQAIHVEANSGMTEELRDVEKVSGAAPQIENALGTHQVEFKLANPPDVNSDPAIEIKIFRPVRAGICYSVSPANLLETGRIDCLDDALCLQLEAVRAYQPERTFSRASQALAIDQFSYFMAKLHSSHLVAKRNNFN